MKKYVSIDGIISRDDQKEISQDQYNKITDDILKAIVKNGCHFGGGVGHHSEEEAEEYLERHSK